MDPHAGQPVVSAGPPVGRGRAVAIMVHGRNAEPANILSLVPALDRPDITYLAPAAANRTWYPLSFLAPIEQNEPYLTSALAAIARVVQDVVTRGVARNRIVLLGFSQGACLSAEFAIRHPARYGGIVLFSGGAIGPPGTTWNSNGSFGQTPVFLGCSDVDAHVPKWRVEETADVFGRMSADVTLRIYPGMGHLVIDDETAHAQRVLDAASR